MRPFARLLYTPISSNGPLVSTESASTAPQKPTNDPAWSETPPAKCVADTEPNMKKYNIITSSGDKLQVQQLSPIPRSPTKRTLLAPWLRVRSAQQKTRHERSEDEDGPGEEGQAGAGGA